VGDLPSGGTTQSGSNVNGTADGLGYGIWSNGSGGSITTFSNAHAFSTSWNNGGDFLAHLGLDFNSSKSYTAYGTIAAQIAESKSGSGGGFSYIGMYGWMQNPCVEWYIVDDSFNNMPTQRSSITATIDGGTYYLIKTETNGTGGNDCGGGASSWAQMWSVRETARQCGTITVSDHFAAWAKQGWGLGNLTSVHINVEVGGGSGSVQFPTANVTTSQ
jgi:endo-1,4-beta-xylanase